MTRTFTVMRKPGPAIVSRVYSTATYPTVVYCRVTGAVNS